jgi:hypothetical protein
MPARYSRFAWILLVPTLALAGPKDHHKKKTDKAAEKKAADEAAAKEAGDAKDAKDAKDTKDAADAKDAKDAKDAAEKPGSLQSGAVGGGGGGAGNGASTGGGNGSGTGSDTEKPAANEPDVDALRQEYLALRDELFKSRARANAVASALYSTRISVKLAWDSGRYYGVSKASIRLDGATVYEDTKGAIAADDGVRFDGYLAPGKHTITFHVDAAGKDDDSFASATETQVVVKAVAGKDLAVAAHARDGGDIAYQWKRTEHGKYGLGIDVSVKTVARTGEKK